MCGGSGVEGAGFIPWSLKIAHPFMFHKQVSTEGRLEGIRIYFLPEKRYPYLRDLCNGFRVLRCLWPISLAAAWRLRQQGCRQGRTSGVQPTNSTKEFSVPRSATKSAPRARGVLRTGRWWSNQHGGSIHHWCSSPLQGQPFTLQPLLSFFHLLTYKQIYQGRVWYTCPYWEVTNWWSVSDHLLAF